MVGFRSRVAAAVAVVLGLTAGVLAAVPGVALAGTSTCPDGQHSLTFGPDPAFVAQPAQGSTSNTPLKATVTVGGIPDPSQTVTFSSDPGNGVSFNPPSTGANPNPPPNPDPPNTYNTTLTVTSATPQSFTVAAQFSSDQGATSCVALATVRLINGSRNVALTFDKPKIPVSTTTSPQSSNATVTVVDSNGGKVSGETVTLTVTNPAADKCDASIQDPNNPLSSGTSQTMADNGDGTYSATINGGKNAAQCVIKAADGAATDQQVLAQYGKPDSIVLSAPQPNSIPGNGVATAVAQATVKDSAGNTVPKASVSFATPDQDVKLAPNPATTDDNGVAGTKLTASKQVGTEQLTAFAGAEKRSNTVTWTQTQPVNTTALTLNPKFLPADGVSTGQAIASVLDSTGAPLAGQNITFSSNGDVKFSATSATTGNDGKASVTITASKTVGSQTITATNTSNNQVATATLGLTTPQRGYWLVASDGGIFSHGTANFYGSEGARPLNKPIVGMAATPTTHGYWLVASDGGIFSHGDAVFFGSEGGAKLNKPIVGMASTPSGKGYWLVASDGGIFSFGDATFFGSTGNITLNKPIVGMATTPTGKGYWLVASDGGIFSFGDATFFGSEGAIKLNQPIVGMASTPTGKGYWLVAADGGIFAHGDAAFFGSTGNIKLNKPVVGMASTPTGQGYWFVATDGGIFNYGDAPFLGSEGGGPLNKPVVGMASSSTA